MLGALPGFGLLLCVGGIYQMNRDAEPYLVPFFLLGFLVLIVGVIRPAWWGPRWFRSSPEGGGRWRQAAR